MKHEMAIESKLDWTTHIVKRITTLRSSCKTKRPPRRQEGVDQGLQQHNTVFNTANYSGIT